MIRSWCFHDLLAQLSDLFPNLTKIVYMYPFIHSQAYVRRVFQSVDDGSLNDLKKLLSCKRYGDIRDRCGRTVLHRAILKQQENMVTFILEDFPEIVNFRDSVSVFVCLVNLPNGENESLNLGFSYHPNS